jgi:hypothetical protein
MRTTVIAGGALLALFSVTAAADDTADLIALDKNWGAAGVKGDSTSIAAMLSDSLVSVTENGTRDKQAELADNEPAPAGTTYEPADYKVTFVDSNTAIMTHSTKGADAHYSMHVWSRKSGSWQVVATSTTPAAKK